MADTQAPDPGKQVLFNLCNDAIEKSIFDTACSLLRIQGMTNGPWDPLEESRDTVMHYGELASAERTDPRKKMRLGLSIYSHVTEMDAPYELASNWLRILGGKPFRSFPFEDIKTRPGVPPSVSAKLARIKEQCDSTKRPEVIDYLNGVVDHGVRNAFYHSDFVITPKEFRYKTKVGGIPIHKAISFDEVKAIVERGLEYYAQFLGVHDSARIALGKMPKEYPQPDGSLLTLRADDKVGLFGLQWDRPGEETAIYERTASGTVCQNITLGGDGLTLNTIRA